MSTTITITKPLAYQVYQRNGSNQADITITGTYTGTAPSGVQARWQGGTWTNISATIGGGTYSGSLTAQTGGQGTLDVRDTGVPAVTASVTYIGVGDVFLVIGQSNAAGELDNSQIYTHATLKAAQYGFTTNTWGELLDPTGANVAKGSVWPLLATYIMASQSVPVAFIPCAVGGTSLVSGSAEWTSAGSRYVDTVARVAAAKVNGIKAMLWYQGENDALAGVTYSAYAFSLTTMRTNLCTSFGLGTIPLVAALIGSCATATDANLDAIRRGIFYCWDNDANIKAGPTAHDRLFSDGTHWKSDAEAAILAARWWRCLKYHYYSGTENARGAAFSTGARTGSLVTVVFSNVTTALQSATAAGWEYTRNSVPITVNSASVTASNTVVLTLGSAPSSGTETVTFCSGDNGAGSQLRDSGVVAEMPPEPIIAQSVTPSGGGSTGRSWYY